MNRRTFCQVLLLIGPAGPVAAAAAAPADVAYKLLRAADAFAVGPLGEAGGASAGETALRRVLRAEDAEPRLKRLLEEATPAGRLYALLGLRWLASPAYPAALRSLRRAPGGGSTVRTQSGCKVAEVSVAWLLDRIDSGAYDAHRDTAKAK